MTLKESSGPSYDDGTANVDILMRASFSIILVSSGLRLWDGTMRISKSARPLSGIRPSADCSLIDYDVVLNARCHPGGSPIFEQWRNSLADNGPHSIEMVKDSYSLARDAIITTIRIRVGRVEKRAA
ncbi:hypothetical protein BJ165DRAFT_1528009 [Panaeolus papilionaceus]|nr:hypothetical protein BJ165DRAFT_1528009 [Panaeolus papilionaceus]